MEFVTPTIEIDRQGETEVKEFGFKMDATAFKLMADNLYTDKILAVMREYSCNARDAMEKAGKGDQPIVIHFPNAFEPFFSVQDNGTGMSPEDAMGLFSTYFDSTKRADNTVTGCFGLGSKAAFAYSDSFTVRVIWNGKIYNYQCTIGEQGVPTIAQMGKPITTDDDNGVTVTVPVQEKDFREFAKKAHVALSRITPLPIITGNAEGVDLSEMDYWVSGDDETWKLHRDYESYSYYGAKPHAIQAGVCYPIDYNKMEGLTETQRNILQLPIDIWFETGQLAVQTSREGLSYDDKTRASIVARLDEVAEQLPPKFQNEFDDCKTLWEAKIKYSEIFGCNSKYPRALRTLLAGSDIGLKFDSKPLAEEAVLNKEDVEGLELVVFKNNEHGNRGRVTAPGYGGKWKFDPSTNIAFMYDDLGHGSHSRVTYALESHGINQKKVFLFKTDDKKMLKVISKALGAPPITPVSLLPKRPRDGNGGSRTYAKVLKWTGRAYDARDSWEPTDKDLSEGGFFVVINRYRVYDGEHQISNFEDTLSTLTDKKILDLDSVPVYGIRQGLAKNLPENAGWINLFDHARELVKAEVERLDIGQMLADQKVIADWRYGYPLSGAHNDILNMGLSHASPLRAFINAFEYMSRSSKGDEDMRRIKAVADVIRVNIVTTEPTMDLKARWEEILEVYPMIRILDNYDLRGYGSKNDNLIGFVKYINMVDGYNAGNDTDRFINEYLATYGDE